MKYVICNYNQEAALALGLDIIDLELIRWFADFQGTKRMSEKIIDGKAFYWLKYQSISEDLPILGLEKRSIMKRFQKISKLGILESFTLREKGTFSYYRFGEKYCELLEKDTINITKQGESVTNENDTKLEDLDRVPQKVQGVCIEKHNGVLQKEHPCASKSTTKDPNTKDPNTKYINNIKESSARTKKIKKNHGEYGHVILSEDEMQNLNDKYSNVDALIKHLDEYIEISGKKYKNCYLVIKKWVVDAVNEKDKKTSQWGQPIPSKASNKGFMEIDDF